MGMADVPRASGSLAELLGDPPVVFWTTRYLKRLLIERHAIRARLENPGGSIILMGSEKVERDPQYSPVVGNDFHLDLIEAEQEVNQLPDGDRLALMKWLNELPPAQVEDYRQARGRVKKKDSSDRQARRKAAAVVENLNAREDS